MNSVNATTPEHICHPSNGESIESSLHQQFDQTKAIKYGIFSLISLQDSFSRVHVT